MSTQVFNKAPSVLSFQRCMIITDALLYNNSIAGKKTPLLVMKHGIRCTQNTNKREQDEESNTKTSDRDEVRNLQELDSAKTAPDTASVIIQFEIKFIDLQNSLFAFADAGNASKTTTKTTSKKEKADQTTVPPKQKIAKCENMDAFIKSVEEFIDRAKNSQGLFDVSCRLARNIANARWIWRNRVYSSAVQVTATNGDQSVTFDALKIPLNNFDEFTVNEIKLGDWIFKGLSGQQSVPLKISCEIDFGTQGVFEVYPSQSYAPGTKGRQIYYANIWDIVDNEKVRQAAFRDQKVSNAIKTIDTWYPTYEELGEPISVEPEGSSLKFNKYLRSQECTSFHLIKRLNVIDENSDEGKFMIACFLRGGVYPG